MKQFENVVKHPAFQKDPLQTITQHISKSVELIQKTQQEQKTLKKQLAKREKKKKKEKNKENKQEENSMETEN